MALLISETAATHLLHFVKMNRCRFARFGALDGGASGYRYTLTPVEAPRVNSTVVYIDQLHGVELCPQSMYLMGTKIDWEQDSLGARYVFHTPSHV